MLLLMLLSFRDVSCVCCVYIVCGVAGIFNAADMSPAAEKCVQRMSKQCHCHKKRQAGPQLKAAMVSRGLLEK